MLIVELFLLYDDIGMFMNLVMHKCFFDDVKWKLKIIVIILDICVLILPDPSDIKWKLKK